MMERYAKQELRTSLLCQSVLFTSAQLDIFTYEAERLFNVKLDSINPPFNSK